MPGLTPPQGSETRKGADLWQHQVSAAYFPLAIQSRDPERFRGRLEIWPFGAVSATRITCDPVMYRRESRHLQDDRDSSVLISVPGGSEVTFRQNGDEARCKPGGFVIERSDAPYEYSHPEADVQWVVKVPRDSVRARIGATERFVGLVQDARSGLASYFLTSLRNAIDHAAHMDPQARAIAGDHLVETLCLALRADDRAIASQTSAVRRAHLHRAEAFIRGHLKNPDLAPALVAEGCGISVRYLYRLFAESGRSVADYIRDCRLVHCDEDLRRNRGATLTAIAYRWGFSDQAQFSRAYREKFGLSPSERRRETTQD